MKKVLVFGTFDGVHEGHPAFLRQACRTRVYADDARMDADGLRCAKKAKPRQMAGFLHNIALVWIVNQWWNYTRTFL